MIRTMIHWSCILSHWQLVVSSTLILHSKISETHCKVSQGIYRFLYWNCLFRLLLIHQPILFNADQFKISLYRSIWYFNTLFHRRKILKIYFLEQRIHQAYKDGIRHFIISAADRNLIAPEVTRDHYARKSGVFRTVTICMKYSYYFPCIFPNVCSSISVHQHR